ncbi:MAG TPA: response regulator transcription factor, partial [Opitutaceae bacterium]|nr:response regulator transcription factor [Opitutaceae bacterium]
EAHFVNEALQAGVSGYILKVNAAREFIDAIRSVLAGRVYLCPEVSTVVVREYQRQMNTPGGAGLQALSEREREVLARIADGLSTKEIAAVLNLSVKTIETHRLHIMAKLKVNSVAELTKHAIREGLSTL